MLVLGTGCAQRPKPVAASVGPGRPLAALEGQDILVLPIQYFGADSAGWMEQITSSREYLATVDDEIGVALRERAPHTRWITAREIAKAARLNAAFASDPYALAAQPLRTNAKLQARLYEPLGTQIRRLVALNDARYALVPIELRF